MILKCCGWIQISDVDANQSFLAWSFERLRLKYNVIVCHLPVRPEIVPARQCLPGGAAAAAVTCRAGPGSPALQPVRSVHCRPPPCADLSPRPS